MPGPPPTPVTADYVCARMVAAFNALPHVSIRAEHGRLERQFPGTAEGAGAAALEAIGWAWSCLDADHRDALLVWASFSVSGRSIEAECERRQWPRRTFEHRWRRAAESIAACLNEHSTQGVTA
jgi:hypothetical protein